MNVEYLTIRYVKTVINTITPLKEAFAAHISATVTIVFSKTQITERVASWFNTHCPLTIATWLLTELNLY